MMCCQGPVAYAIHKLQAAVRPISNHPNAALAAVGQAQLISNNQGE